jgi:hypothetical protein
MQTLCEGCSICNCQGFVTLVRVWVQCLSCSGSCVDK